jgi:hypothetical protein
MAWGFGAKKYINDADWHSTVVGLIPQVEEFLVVAESALRHVDEIHLTQGLTNLSYRALQEWKDISRRSDLMLKNIKSLGDLSKTSPWHAANAELISFCSAIKEASGPAEELESALLGGAGSRARGGGFSQRVAVARLTLYKSQFLALAGHATESGKAFLNAIKF